MTCGVVMKRIAILGALGLTAGALAGDSAASVSAFSRAAIDMLDPTRIAAQFCGSRRGGGDALRSRIQLAAMLQSSAAGSGAGADVPLILVSRTIRLPVTTRQPLVARYVRQGLLLTYGFNHGAAIESFRAAQRLDPDCAICFWGEAFALGPNINAPMAPEVLAQAIAASKKAESLAGNASPTEQALIAALGHRYSADPATARTTLDKAYQDEMLAAAARFPKDDDVAVLAAEAVMDVSPWDYWQADGQTPKGRIGEAVRLVEIVLARTPSHPQAEHLYIHLMEANGNPTRAVVAADSLAAQPIPAAGHLIHMPGHIYYRIGRFKDSIAANVDAALADEAYLARAGDNPVYRFGYYPHNVHFLLTSAQMAGDMKVVTQQAERLSKVVNADFAAQLGWTQPVVAAPYMAYAQFASPEEILALPPADGRLDYVVAARHYARAVAFAQRQDQAGFDKELAAIATIKAGAGIKAMNDQGVPGDKLLTIAELVAKGRYAFAAGRYDEAADQYRRAIAIEDVIPYQEPPYWYYPVRQSLGAALFAAGRYGDARDAFMGALVRSPNNGWALYGLAESQRALGATLEAAAADAALKRAWLGDSKWLRMDRL